MDPTPLRFLLLLFAGWVNREQQSVIEYLLEERRTLLEHAGGASKLRFTDKQRRRLAAKAKSVPRKLLERLGTLVTRDTLQRWYKRLIADKYDGSKRRGPGRPKTTPDIETLVVTMARGNDGWGYTRIVGALKYLGHVICRNTVKRILKDHGIEPAPHRGMSWKTFVKAHWGAIAACEFFTVEVLKWTGLVRQHVFFVIDLASRRVHIAGICHEPGGRWMEQAARNLTDTFDGFLKDARYLIHDRDPLVTEAFRKTLAAGPNGGVKTVRLPARSPNLNAFAERFVLSVKSECLDNMIPLGERHLRTAVREFAAHYHLERPHQGLGNVLIDKRSDVANDTDGDVVCRERLGGLLKFYARRAA